MEGFRVSRVQAQAFEGSGFSGWGAWGEVWDLGLGVFRARGIRKLGLTVQKALVFMMLPLFVVTVTFSKR